MAHLYQLLFWDMIKNKQEFSNLCYNDIENKNKPIGEGYIYD